MRKEKQKPRSGCVHSYKHKLKCTYLRIYSFGFDDFLHASEFQKTHNNISFSVYFVE